MINIGQINTLSVTKQTDFGYFLDADDFGSVLLPNKFASDNIVVGSDIDVMLYFDSDNQLSATTETPIAQVGQWGMMHVVGVNNIGAFVDWGIDKKDLLVPFSNQRVPLTEGQSILVYVYSDSASGRIVGTTKFNKLLDKTSADYAINDQVDLLIAERTDLGFKAIIHEKHWGVIFKSDVFGKLFVGKRLKGYIKEIRDDGRINLSLQKIGIAKMDDLSEKVIHVLETKGGFLPLSDKSTPEAIFTVFRTSKGTFKKTIGGLYKAGKIRIENDGIYLV
ncbi:GntR family transcriptional regulator [Vibrio sp. S17_S38]|uniref:CvfB family protein n=1 Tax=Vibrio sp. S17_S38 TaxID=2720229 RepID=UPI0016816144|nr:S1-like domain-containing RNA-binding protein [Vibrio sp. S17_S38]MBD1574781.1 GntR family transcriptional regulator [Vibrio sp. S17_S38]